MERNTKVFLGFVFFLIIILLFFMLVSLPKNKTNENEIIKVSTGFFPALGQGEIKIIEFSDFACPVCKTQSPILKKLLEEENITIYYRNFPLSMHENSFNAALASMCANEQDKFWEYHDLLFENQGKFEKEKLKDYAKQLSLNMSSFSNCLDKEKYKNQVNEDIKEGKEAGVKGTPTFFVNGKKFEGFQSFENFKSIIEKEK